MKFNNEQMYIRELQAVLIALIHKGINYENTEGRLNPLVDDLMKLLIDIRGNADE